MIIVLLLILFAASTTYLVFKVKGSIVAKTASAAILFTSASFTYFSVDGIKGWPTTEDLPSQAIVMAVDVQEPANDDAGGIFLWVRYDFSGVSFVFAPTSKFTPRSYEVLYTENNAKQAEAMQKALKSGMMVVLSNGNVAGEGDGEGEGNTPSSGFYLEGTESNFRILNPAELLQKK